LSLDDKQLLKNLRSIQERNNIPKSPEFIKPGETYPFVNYSVEMETGTGKTYVYLRTILDLNRKYDFKKFIIIVPSITIREGVLSSIDLMREHFKVLYDNVCFGHFAYDSGELSKVRQFAVSNEIQIMAVVTENGEKLYLVRESKNTHDRDKRREDENRKIDCGQAHFDALGVNFKVTTNIHEVLAP
jgi:type III restriction enzyme